MTQSTLDGLVKYIQKCLYTLSDKQSYSEGSSITSAHAPDSASSSDVLSEVLKLPQPKPSKKRKPGINSKAIRLTDTDVVKRLEAEAEEKLHKQQKENAKRIERERKKMERE